MTNDRDLPEALQSLPGAIWCPGGVSPSIYRGAPVEMVRQMAAEMGPQVTLEQAIEVVLHNLAAHKRIFIGLPSGVSEEIRAGIFIYALLDIGISRPMALA